MHTIYKYKIDPEVSLPKEREFLSVAVQGGELFCWYIVNPDSEKEVVRFYVVGTGWTLPDDWMADGELYGTTYRGTALIGPFVWHVFGDDTKYPDEVE